MSLNITEEKTQIIHKLERLQDRISDLDSQFDIDLTDLSDKVNKAISNIEKDVFSIAFFGAFSDGKSTILSVLVKKLDIRISPEPTTDTVVPYEFEDYKIIDTPGLFSDNLLHDDSTRKFISEANIIIYTMDAVNPLKDSHLPTLKWILSDLKKADSTIFVINKMDEVADLEEQDDFKKKSDIKKQVVTEILTEVAGPDTFDRMVCVAADPFQQGLEYWSKNEQEYRNLSRIQDLETTIADFKSEYRSALVLKGGLSVISDAGLQITEELREIKTHLNAQRDLLQNQTSEFENRLATLNEDISRSFIRIKEELISLREDILTQCDGISSTAELAQLMQNQFGEDGYIMQEKIDLIIRKQSESIVAESENLFRTLEESLVYHSKLQDKMLSKLSDTGKAFVRGMMSAPTRKIADAILKTRDILKIPIKFKPWGATKFAKVLKGLPVLLEALELVFSLASHYKLDQKLTAVKTDLSSAFKELIQNLTLESYIENYFPHAGETRAILLSLSEGKKEVEQTAVQIDSIIEDLDIATFH